MKTNYILVREDVSFMQRIKDGYFNATVLLDNWNKKDNVQVKQMARYKENLSTKDFICQLQKEGIDKPMITGRGKGGGTWMHPKLFIDFAMWVSVEFKSKVIDYVLDGLVKSRHDAGDYYNEMVAMVMKKYIEIKGVKPPYDLYMNEARMIKDIVGVTDRNKATESQLNIITSLQKLNTQLISDNVGKDSRKKQLVSLFKALNL